MSDQLAEQIKKLVETEAVQRLLFDYAYYLDMNMPKELASLFTEDCVVTYGPNFGAEGIEAYAKTLEGIGPYFEATSHHVSNVVVDLDGDDTASVRSVLLAWHRYRKQRPDSTLWGQYHDKVVKIDGKWRFKRRELRTAGTQDFHVKENHPIGRK